MKTACILRHLAFEDLGSFGPVIETQGYQVEFLEAGLDPLRPLLHADLAVILGGPIGVYEREKYPFLADEITMLTERLQARRPTLGICLGAQLMAHALGEKVYPGPAKEIGWAPLTLTAAGERSPIRHLDGSRTSMLHWHGDTFDLPPEAILLASTPLCKHQAFSIGNHALALQCHPEFDERKAEQWLIGHCCELAGAQIDIPALRSDCQRHGPSLRERSQAFLREWLLALEPLPL